MFSLTFLSFYPLSSKICSFYIHNTLSCFASLLYVGVSLPLESYGDLDFCSVKIEVYKRDNHCDTKQQHDRRRNINCT